jgi:hypothetical protein
VRRHWRHFYSSRLQAAKSFSTFEDWVNRALAAESLPWSEADPIIQTIFRESDHHKETVIRSFGTVLHAITLRELQASARLLRVACRFRATGEVLELQDPFGGNLRTTVTEGHLRAWSRGPFAVEPAPQEPVGGSKSILRIEVDRR